MIKKNLDRIEIHSRALDQNPPPHWQPEEEKIRSAIIDEIKSERIHSFILELLTEQVDFLFSSDNQKKNVCDESVSKKKIAKLAGK
jgi:hypothetical protein